MPYVPVSTTQTRVDREPVASDQADVTLITFIAEETEPNLGSLGVNLGGICEANLHSVPVQAQQP